MCCKQIVNLMSKDKISSAERTVLNTHFEKCASCKEKFLLLNKTFSLLEQEVILPHNDFTDKIMSKIGLKENATARDVTPLHRYFGRLVPATAMATVVLVAGLLFLQKNKPSEVVITFKIAMPDAQAVTLAGDFNGWDTESLKLKKQNGSWEIKLPLSPGRYQYAFVIDGRNWIPDPRTKNYVDSGYGMKNSILDTAKL